MVALRGSARGYELSDHDVDLQDNPPSTGFASRGKETAAIHRALTLINAKADVNVRLSDFVVTKTAAGDAGPHTAVEWKCVLTKGHGDRETTYTFLIDLDDIPSGATGAGPDRPHVGYSIWARGHNGTNSRINGHVFIEYVSASRPHT